MNNQTTSTFDGENDEPPENSAGAPFKIDYTEIWAATEPGHPGGRVVYDSYDYDTQEEADAALDEFFRQIIEAPYEETH